MRPILTLDLSAKRTGWACAPPDAATLRFGSIGFGPEGGSIGTMLREFDAWLNGMCGVENPMLIVFEAPLKGGKGNHATTTRKLFALAAHVEFVCEARGIRCMEHHVASVKKELAGNGHAKKDDMIAAAQNYGWAVRNDDEADACGLWLSAVLYRFPAYSGRFKLGALGRKAGLL